MIDIETSRCVLRLVPLAGLAATAARDIDAAGRIIGPNLSEEWFELDWVADLRLNQWKQDPQYAPWSIRAITLRSTGEIVGSINCHDRPKPFRYNGDEGQAIEIGYTIFSPWRRKGFASEAVRQLFEFAAGSGVKWVVLSILPDNAPSQHLAKKLGAYKVDSQLNEENMPEDIYLVDIQPALTP
jgi:RimJ/RimL family protein N-acetyltransferase